VLFHRLGPYHFARLRAAGRLLPIVAIESSGVDKTYAWDKVVGADHFERVTLFDHSDAHKLPAAEVVSRIGSALEKVHPVVVVVPGWADSAALGALRWCVQKQVPAVAMSESTVWDKTRSVWREAVKRQIVGLCSTALVGGTPHKDYMIQLGMPAERVFLGYDAVDNRYFADKVAEVRSQKSEVGRKFGLPENYFLASARFVEKKNLPRLIEAYARYRQLAAGSVVSGQVVPWSLVLLGDGALRSDLCRLISDLRLQDSVLLPGFKQYPDLPAYYGLANAFIHASIVEPWGLVVNEAMASGLPVLVSNRCGCAMDLVKDGVNGFTFDPYNIEEMAQLMLKLSTLNPSQLSTMCAASQHIIANWGPERFAQGLKAAAEKALRVGPAKASPMQRLILRALLHK
jgi:glycosyltransferase involved in cell wall biosynthesis